MFSRMLVSDRFGLPGTHAVPHLLPNLAISHRPGCAAPLVFCYPYTSVLVFTQTTMTNVLLETERTAGAGTYCQR